MPCRIPPTLAWQCRDALIELEADGTVYVGFVNTRTRSDILECRGYQDRLSWTRKGIVYRDKGSAFETTLEAGVKVTKTRVVNGWRYSFGGDEWAAGGAAELTFDFPEPVVGGGSISLVAIECEPNGIGTFSVMHRTGYDVTGGTTSKNAIGQDQVSSVKGFPAGTTSVVVRFYVDAPVPSGQTQIHELTIEYVAGSNVSNTVQAVFAAIMADAGVTHYDCTVDGVVESLAFPASSSPLDKITELVRWGDWRAYFTTRPGSSTPVFIFEPMPTSPDYSLTEDGNTVTADIAIETRSVASVVRAHFTDEYGRERFAEYADPDTSHFLVNAGRQVYYDTEVDTQSYATALSAATALAGKLGADRASGTLVLKGAPGGIPASSYAPGLFQVATRRSGTITSRATSITYTGRHKAVVTLDDTFTAETLLTRIASLERGGNRIR